MTRLPNWVQVSSGSAPLHTADSGSKLAGPKLARYTFLRVLGGGTSRLQVDAYDENGAQGLRGWIDADYVLPSAPGTDWLVSSTATTLWRSADGAADSVRSIDRFTPLQQVDGPVGNRVQVRVYRSDFSMLDQGWVDQADTGQALTPQTRVPSPTGERSVGARTASGANQQQAFIDATAQAARTAAAQTGVPASVTVAQAILESDWGRSLLAQNANNYFGMKAMGTLGTDGVVWMPTSEYDDAGELYQTVSAFRAYKSLTESLTDHDRLLQTASRYAAAMRASNNPQEFASRLYEAGYSTDPQYADKLVALMDRYNLYSLDA
jgi:Mannosyl-glycoprotein endo-beta-N-acetylglucosaminidase